MVFICQNFGDLHIIPLYFGFVNTFFKKICNSFFRPVNNNKKRLKRGEIRVITILLRTAIIYVALIIAMRLMGKRQIGELEVSELVTTLLISEVASLPITDAGIPVSHALIPIITLLFFEVGSSMLSVTFPRLKNLFSARPTTLIRNGKFCLKAMRGARITADELIGELRQQGIVDISEVLYAILEQNGKITVLQKAKYRMPTAEQMKIKTSETGICHIVVDKGVINEHSLSELGIDRARLDKILHAQNVALKDIYLMIINDAGDVNLVRKDESRI